MASVMPFDEMNKLEERIRERFASGKLERKDEEDIIDEMFDLFLLAYATGNTVTNENLSSSYEPTLDDVIQVVDERVAGETWRERVENYFANGGTGDDIIRIIETETHRISNTSALNTARRAGATTKTWVTMADDKVRDPHVYLDGITVGIDDEFVTYDGGHAQAPGLFGVPELDINCRCFLVFE